MSAILFLHGGGSSDHTRYTRLQELFSKEGVVTHAFDHKAASLAERLQEAENELAYLKAERNQQDIDIFIWGSSMGGHVACRLTETHPDLAGLILQSAAAYSASAEATLFGSDFTTEITRENSWQDSPAFTAVEKYKGPVLVMYGEFDDVIPQGIKDRYHNSADKYILLTGGIHSMLRPETPVQHKVWQEMYMSSLSFVHHPGRI